MNQMCEYMHLNTYLVDSQSVRDIYINIKCDLSLSPEWRNAITLVLDPSCLPLITCPPKPPLRSEVRVTYSAGSRMPCVLSRCEMLGCLLHKSPFSLSLYPSLATSFHLTCQRIRRPLQPGLISVGWVGGLRGFGLQELARPLHFGEPELTANQWVRSSSGNTLGDR